ncbi:DeoR/GlpR family DNA-binding transcription regulator [Nesterenkonia halotolerans]|uniref:DeoR/GlpR family transcriptional regulator of sugar metabolism n=1 Tax=Nesterenkonia halotolerans TaxID=225325 RepID=A0ABR9J4Y3_9MICC|nr:DeoR/GlpR family DNA-binding transcription regulator [Nesterenkonia halotolerans]MBE1514051.1 DeoR/GlpR family transcriptional regulator of sugar metabolism [Nesterenkonia halotolerans]
MLAAQRRAGIVALLESAGGVSVSELAARFEVSDMTIRRDLENLAEAGLIAKVHGGAVAPAADAAAVARRTEEPGFEAKSAQMLPEKQAIAAAAAELLAPGMSVGLSAGTTTWALAHHLLTVPELTVVTNSPRIAAIFHRAADAHTDAHTAGQTRDAADPRVILTGGVRTPSDALVGPIANQALRSLHLDLVFLGTHGFSSAAGFTTPNLEEAETNRTLLQSGARAVVLADHTKWGATALGTFARIAQIDTLISDTGLPDPAAAELREQLMLTLAETTETRRS